MKVLVDLAFLDISKIRLSDFLLVHVCYFFILCLCSIVNYENNNALHLCRNINPLKVISRRIIFKLFILF